MKAIIELLRLIVCLTFYLAYADTVNANTNFVFSVNVPSSEDVKNAGAGEERRTFDLRLKDFGRVIFGQVGKEEAISVESRKGGKISLVRGAGGDDFKWLRWDNKLVDIKKEKRRGLVFFLKPLELDLKEVSIDVVRGTDGNDVAIDRDPDEPIFKQVPIFRALGERVFGFIGSRDAGYVADELRDALESHDIKAMRRRYDTVELATAGFENGYISPIKVWGIEGFDEQLGYDVDYLLSSTYERSLFRKVPEVNTEGSNHDYENMMKGQMMILKDSLSSRIDNLNGFSEYVAKMRDEITISNEQIDWVHRRRAKALRIHIEAASRHQNSLDHLPRVQRLEFGSQLDEAKAFLQRHSHRRTPDLVNVFRRGYWAN